MVTELLQDILIYCNKQPMKMSVKGMAKPKVRENVCKYLADFKDILLIRRSVKKLVIYIANKYR